MTRYIDLGAYRLVQVDDEDYEWLSKTLWYVAPDTGLVTGLHFTSPATAGLVELRRAVMLALPGDRVEYRRPGDTLDHRKSSLRLVPFTPRVPHFWMLSYELPGVLGVKWHRWRRQYSVRGYYDGVWYDLGYFEDPQAAALMYDAWARLVVGPRALLNFPYRPTPPELAARVAEHLGQRS